LLGTVDRAVLLLCEDRKSLFTEEQLSKLDELRFSNEIIAELDYKVCRENQALDAGTRCWKALQ
jgi:glycine betaine/proline transport system substrate-binding protein